MTNVLVHFLMLRHNSYEETVGDKVLILAGSLRELSKGGEAWRQEYKAAGRTAPTVRKQREGNAGAQLIFSFVCSPGPQPLGWHLPHSGWVFPSQLN